MQRKPTETQALAQGGAGKTQTRRNQSNRKFLTVVRDFQGKNGSRGAGGELYGMYF